ncbi:MAG: isoprenyl transferase [Rikenellaceae bacterium]
MNGKNKIPRHIAIIMDGNGRWAQEQGKERVEGHVAGVKSVRRAIESALEVGVEYLTIYAFSTENWGRPIEEVNALMELFASSVASETPELCEQGVRVKIIGKREALSSKVREALSHIETQTQSGEKLTFVIALNYSSRDEITRAVRKIAGKVERGEITSVEIDDSLITESLDTAGIPDPDLIVRTSGESRLSNFLLWQSSYAEMYFPQVLWPDFDRGEFIKAIEVYSSRDRRFGLVKEEK